MDHRTVLAALGTGITTFLVVAVAVIALLDVEFSAIVGLPTGLLAGAAAFALIQYRYDSLGRVARVMVDAVAGFGFGIVLLLGVNYVNLADLAFEATVGGAAVVGVLAGARSWLAGQNRRPG
jgi:hypothetical protein